MTISKRHYARRHYQTHRKQLVAYYARHAYTLARKKPFMPQRSMRSFAADPTGYHILAGNQ